jgi:hypothetical protein
VTHSAEQYKPAVSKETAASIFRVKLAEQKSGDKQVAARKIIPPSLPREPDAVEAISGCTQAESI